jgi:hypothetical protein
MSDSTWRKIGAVGGIAFIVLQMAGQLLFQSGGAEPAFNAPAAEILEFFQAKDAVLFEFGGFLTSLSFIAFLWFLGSLYSTLSRGEGQPAWISLIAVASGVLMVVPVVGGSWMLAVFRIDEGLEPDMARLLFDQGNFGFAILWVFAASFLLATAVVAIRSGALPRWLAWAGVVIAVVLLVARAFWATPSSAIFTAYVLFGIWLIAASVVLFRASDSQTTKQDSAS